MRGTSERLSGDNSHVRFFKEIGGQVGSCLDLAPGCRIEKSRHIREGIERSGHNPFLIAVTVLTSMDQLTLNQLGVAGKLQDQVLNLARLTQEAGLDGVVCSAMEALELREMLGKQFLLVTPGIRPAHTDLNDQSRVASPALALNFGASYLVIGRPITQARSPLAALEAIHREITPAP